MKPLLQGVSGPDHSCVLGPLSQAGIDSLPVDGSKDGAGGCQGAPGKTKPFGFEDTTPFLLRAFLRCFSSGLEYELSVSPACILVKSSQICEKPYTGVS